MGYSYGYSPTTGGQALACDHCGKTGGVRKRTCPHKVLGDTLRCKTRSEMRYCPPPAYCSDCFHLRGGTKGIHAACATAAAAAQAAADAVEAGLDAGEKFVVAAWGDWADGVPRGHTRVLFIGRDGETYALIPAATYQPGVRAKLSDYPAAQIVPD